MTRIPIVQESQATGKTKQLYDDIRAFFGFPAVPDVMKVVSTRPDLLRVMFEGYKAMFGGGHLPRQVAQGPRTAGLSEDEILEGVWVACQFNAVDCLADAFGLYDLMQLQER